MSNSTFSPSPLQNGPLSPPKIPLSVEKLWLFLDRAPKKMRHAQVEIESIKFSCRRKSASVEVEAVCDSDPAPPPKLRRFLLRERLAKQRPRTAAAAAAAANAAAVVRVATFPAAAAAMDPVTMMGWIPARTLTRASVGRVRAPRPLLRTSNSTEASY